MRAPVASVPLCLLILATFAPAGAWRAATADPAQGYTPQELEQLVGPVALYPDTVLASLLPATTYPADVAAAAAHVGQQGGKPSQPPAGATWDASVNALLQLPDVLTWLAQNAAWGEQMAYALSVQQRDVMSAVQAFRKKAQAAGNLTSNEHQTVSTQDTADGGTEVIVIESSDPTVIYVPVYQPVAVVQPGYTAWAWGAGFAAGVFTAWAVNDFDWHNGGEINVSRNTNVTVNNTNVNAGNRVGPNRPQSWNPTQPRTQKPTGGVRQPSARVGGAGGAGGAGSPGGAGRPGGATGAGAASRPSTMPATRPPPARPATAPSHGFAGASDGARARQQSDRGNSSLGRSAGGGGGRSAGGGGGGGRGGGGGGGGGRRR